MKPSRTRSSWPARASLSPLLVFGGGGQGKVVADAARSSGLSPSAFVDDDDRKDGTTFYGLPVLSWRTWLGRRDAYLGASWALGIGDNAARARVHERLLAEGVEALVVVHQAAVVAPTASVGAGTVLLARAVVNPDAVVGAGCIINTGAVVEHDCKLGAFVHLSPNAALGGGVTIGDRTHLGLGAVVLPGVRLGRDVTVGAGAVVLGDVPDGLTVVGVPARRLERRARAQSA